MQELNFIGGITFDKMSLKQCITAAIVKKMMITKLFAQNAVALRKLILFVFLC